MYNIKIPRFCTVSLIINECIAQENAKSAICSNISSLLSGNSIEVLTHWEENDLWASLQSCVRHLDLWLRHNSCSSSIQSSAKTSSLEFGGSHHAFPDRLPKLILKCQISNMQQNKFFTFVELDRGINALRRKWPANIVPSFFTEAQTAYVPCHLPSLHVY